jgi:lipopolysaccharide export system protein LptA
MAAMMKRLIALASALAISTLAAASAAHAQIGRGDAAVFVEADNLEYFQEDGRAVYTGNVRATQGEARITTDKLTAVCSRPSAPTGQSASDQPCEEIRQLVAENNVLYTAPDLKIRGDRAEYDYPTDTITITGDVIMTRGQEAVIRGSRIVYNVGAGLSRMTAGNNRVQSILTPQEKRESSQPAQRPPAQPAPSASPN